jgi:hypothetical protein
MAKLNGAVNVECGASHTELKMRGMKSVVLSILEQSPDRKLEEKVGVGGGDGGQCGWKIVATLPFPKFASLFSLSIAPSSESPYLVLLLMPAGCYIESVNTKDLQRQDFLETQNPLYKLRVHTEALPQPLFLWGD